MSRCGGMRLPPLFGSLTVFFVGHMTAHNAARGCADHPVTAQHMPAHPANRRAFKAGRIQV